ncbi:MAG: TAXI family TRAP transporter solute-binding subunit [Rickettsiales bacterium]
MMRKHFLGFTVFFVAAATLLSTPASAGNKFITFGTAGVTGVYYPVGGTICHFVNRKSKEHGIRCAVELTGGSIANLTSIREHDLDMGFAQSDWQYNAYNGTGAFSDQGANPDLRSVFSLHSEAFTVVARADSGVHSFDDLRGKIVNIGNPGSGMRGTMDEVMRAKGWNLGVFKAATEYRAADQAAKLCKKEIDAFVFATGHPNGSIQEVANNCNSKLVNVDGPDIEKLFATYPYYSLATIPGGMYTNNPEDIKTFGVKATVVTSKDVDEELIYQVVKAVFENFDDFKTTHPILANLDKKEMISNGLTAPLHEGAKRYYREVGLLKE